MMGEIWLRKHLAKKKKTVEELAGRLWRDNLTAIAEVRYFLHLYVPVFASSDPAVDRNNSYATTPLKNTFWATLPK